MKQTQEQIEHLRTIQETSSFWADVAENQLPALADKIDNIKLPEIDTTELAKESTIEDVKAGLESVSGKIDGIQVNIDGIAGAELLAAKQLVIKSLQDKGSDVTDNATLVDVADKIDKLIVIPQGQLVVDGEFKSLEELLTTQTAIDTFYSEATSFWWSVYNNSFMYWFSRLFNVKRYILPNLTQTSQGSLPSDSTGAVYIYAPSIAGVVATNSFCSGTNSTVCIDVKNANTTGNYFMRYCNSLRHLFYNAHSGSQIFYGNYAPLLYDIRKTFPYESNVVYTNWQAATALLTSSTSILGKDEWDDPNEPTETFTCNRDKFMWYFKNHFMQDFADMSGAETPPTLTLYSAMYDVVMADEEVVNHFSSRGWTVAKG